MRRLRADVLVVGGGPAGGAAAVELLRSGRDVLIAEAAPGPRDRVCGEFVSAEARPLLEHLGVLSEVLSLAPPAVTRARFTAPGGAEASFDLPPPPAGGAALGVRRRNLDDVLLRRAERAGARVLRGARFLRPRTDSSGSVSGAELVGPDGATEVTARILVGADGRASPVARSLGLDLPARGRGHCAIKAHFRPRELAGAPSGTVEIHMFAGGYVGFGPVDGGLVNVSAVIDAALARLLGGGALDVLLGAASRSGPARRRLALMDPVSRALALYPLDRRRSAPAGDGFLLAGDAAQVVPPFTGDGISAAVRSGMLAAEAANAVLERGNVETAIGMYARAHRGALGPAARAGRTLERLVHRPALAAPLVALLGGAPFVARALVRATRINA